MYTARVEDACLPHHLCPCGGSILGPTGPEARALPWSHGPPPLLWNENLQMANLNLKRQKEDMFC